MKTKNYETFVDEFSTIIDCLGTSGFEVRRHLNRAQGYLGSTDIEHAVLFTVEREERLIRLYSQACATIDGLKNGSFYLKVIPTDIIGGELMPKWMAQSP